MAKRVEVTYDEENHVMTISPVTLDDSVSINLDDVFPGAIAALRKTKNGEVAVQTFVHGFRQKIGDSYADKSQVPDEDVCNTVSGVAESRAAGTWNTRGVGGGGKGKPTLLEEAILQLMQKKKPDATLEDARQFLDAKSDEEQKKLRKHPQVAGIIDDLRAERAAEKAKRTKESAGEAEELSIF